jgi:hypothetical protein
VHPEALIAVIKDNSMNVDRFERDAAQDGFIQRWIDDGCPDSCFASSRKDSTSAITSFNTAIPPRSGRQPSSSV